MIKDIEKKKMCQCIINTALHLCIKEGLSHLKMKNIAYEMGISPPEDIYLYFESKKALIKKILQEHLETIQKHLQPEKYEETLNRLMDTLKESSLIHEEESYFLPIFSEAFLPYLQSDNIVKEYRYFFNELDDFFTQELEKGINSKKLNPNTNTTALAKILIAMLDGAILHKGILTSKEHSQLTLVKKAIQLFKKELWHPKQEKLVA